MQSWFKRPAGLLQTHTHKHTPAQQGLVIMLEVVFSLCHQAAGWLNQALLLLCDPGSGSMRRRRRRAAAAPSCSRRRCLPATTQPEPVTHCVCRGRNVTVAELHVEKSSIYMHSWSDSWLSSPWSCCAGNQQTASWTRLWRPAGPPRCDWPSLWSGCCRQSQRPDTHRKKRLWRPSWEGEGRGGAIIRCLSANTGLSYWDTNYLQNRLLRQQNSLRRVL